MPHDNTAHPQMRAVVTMLAFLCFVPAPLSCDAWIIPSLTRLQLRSTASSAQSDIAPERVRQSLAYTSDLTDKWKVTQHSAFPSMCNDYFVYIHTYMLFLVVGLYLPSPTCRRYKSYQNHVALLRLPFVCTDLVETCIGELNPPGLLCPTAVQERGYGCHQWGFFSRGTSWPRLRLRGKRLSMVARGTSNMMYSSVQVPSMIRGTAVRKAFTCRPDFPRLPARFPMGNVCRRVDRNIMFTCLSYSSYYEYYCCMFHHTYKVRNQSILEVSDFSG